MSIGFFLFGISLMAIGFFAIWKTPWFIENLGEISDLLQFQSTKYLNWKTFGLILMIMGFIIAFGLFELFFQVVFGRFINFQAFGGDQ
jgi:hypothetical protein